MEQVTIPPYIKMNKDVNNPRFIPDGMNEFERNNIYNNCK